MIDIEKLEALAKALPSKGWRHHVHNHPKSNTYSHTIITDEDFGDVVAYTKTVPASEQEDAVAAFIAAANPAAVLELIAEIQWLRETPANQLAAAIVSTVIQGAAAGVQSGIMTTVQNLREENEALNAKLRAFTGSAYPVATEINERGYNWSEAWLDEALAMAQEQQP